MRTWVDASTLIALDAAGELGLLRDLVGRLAVTEEISREISQGRESAGLRRAREEWIGVVKVRGDRERWERLGLGRGEASLFLTPKEDRLVLDEIAAQTVAEAEGRSYVGLLGLLLAGVRSGIVPATRAAEVLGKLVRSGFHLSTALYDAAMGELGANR